MFLMNAEKSGQCLTLCRVPGIVRFIKLYFGIRIPHPVKKGIRLLRKYCYGFGSYHTELVGAKEAIGGTPVFVGKILVLRGAIL